MNKIGANSTKRITRNKEPVQLEPDDVQLNETDESNSAQEPIHIKCENDFDMPSVPLEVCVCSYFSVFYGMNLNKCFVITGYLFE